MSGDYFMLFGFWRLSIWDWGSGLGLRLPIGTRDMDRGLKMGFEIEDWGLRLGIGIWIWNLGLMVWIEDWDQRLEVGVRIRD